MTKPLDPDMARLQQSRLDYVNYRAEKLIELAAADIAELGVSSYASALRMLLFYALGLLVQESSLAFRRFQTGLVQNYALLMLFGIFASVGVYLLLLAR